MKVLLAVILGVLLAQSNAYSPTQTCAVVQTNNFIADPEDCSGYYFCVDGAINFHGNCGNGLLYNSYTGSCDYSDNVQCNFGAEICKSYTAPVYLPDPTDCSSYIYCDGKGKTFYNNCPTGQDFDPSSISCQWATQDSCAGDPCDLVPNNVFVAYGKKTNEEGQLIYGSMTCSNGVGTPHWCPPDYIYDSINGICDYDNNVDQAPKCTVAEGAVQIGSDVFAASPSNCNEYYFCYTEKTAGVVPATITPTLLKCPQKFHFNAGEGQCVYSWTYKPAGANANCDRCGGWKVDMWVANPNNCNTYFTCTALPDGSLTSKGVKPGECSNSKFPYFSEQSQSCVGKAQGFCLTP